MDFELTSLIELYAYKVADLEKGVEPAGGTASLLRLRKYLLEASPGGVLSKRFREVDRRYRSISDKFSEQAGEKAELEPQEPLGSELDIGIVDLPLEEDLPTHVSDKREIVQELAEDVFWTRLRKELSRIARNYLRGKRYELRLIYAFLQNFEAYSSAEDFAGDFNLSRFKLSEPLPALSDPLITLDNEEIALALLRELFDIAMGLGKPGTYPISLPPEGIVPYLRRFLRRIVEVPEALPLRIPGGGPSSEELRAALDEARRSALTVHEREALVRDLEDKLRKAAAEERRIRLVVEEDRNRFLAAAEKVAALLRRYLPAPKGESALPIVPRPLEEGDAGPKLTALPEGATLVTFRRVPVRLRLGGIPITLSVVGDDTQLTIAGRENTLNEGEPLISLQDNWEVWAFLRGDFVHVRLEIREGAQLSKLLSEGNVLAYLVHPYKDYAFLRLMRAFAARLKGPVDYREYHPEAADKFREAPLDALEDFARKGLGVVKERLQRSPGGVKLMREVATAMRLQDEGKRLLQALTDWLNFRPPTRETLGGELGVATVASEPVNLKVGNLVLSVRQADGVVYVGAAGEVPRKLEDLITWPYEEGVLVIAREGVRIAHSTVKIIEKAD